MKKRNDKYSWPSTNHHSFAECEISIQGEWLGQDENNKTQYAICTLALMQIQHKQLLEAFTKQATIITTLSEKVDHLTEMIQFLPPTNGGPEFVAASQRQAEVMKK